MLPNGASMPVANIMRTFNTDCFGDNFRGTFYDPNR
jgi:hypothetical protein